MKAFSSCKIILTTRMNNIERIIPTKETIVIGLMEQNEAICLITNGIISKVSQEDLISLNELAQDIHLGHCFCLLLEDNCLIT